MLAILGDLLATEHLADAQEFARMAQRRLATAEASRSRGVKQAPFVVLMGVQMPAVLVEVGFITNAREEGRLDERRRARAPRRRGSRTAVAAFRAGRMRGSAWPTPAEASDERSAWTGARPTSCGRCAC